MRMSETSTEHKEAFNKLLTLHNNFLNQTLAFFSENLKEVESIILKNAPHDQEIKERFLDFGYLALIHTLPNKEVSEERCGFARLLFNSMVRISGEDQKLISFCRSTGQEVVRKEVLTKVEVEKILPADRPEIKLQKILQNALCHYSGE
jgi:hypothetical protein